jgi:hypothetical protein
MSEQLVVSLLSWFLLRYDRGLLISKIATCVTVTIMRDDLREMSTTSIYYVHIPTCVQCPLCSRHRAWISDLCAVNPRSPRNHEAFGQVCR